MRGYDQRRDVIQGVYVFQRGSLANCRRVPFSVRALESVIMGWTLVPRFDRGVGNTVLEI